MDIIKTLIKKKYYYKYDLHYDLSVFKNLSPEMLTFLCRGLMFQSCEFVNHICCIMFIARNKPMRFILLAFQYIFLANLFTFSFCSVGCMFDIGFVYVVPLFDICRYDETIQVLRLRLLYFFHLYDNRPNNFLEWSEKLFRSF